jgi:hypothetical protein
MITSLQDKQHALFASLFRYSQDAIPLRHRVLNRVVLAALINSTEDSPMTDIDIANAIRTNTKSPNLRLEVVQQTLLRLVEGGKVNDKTLEPPNVRGIKVRKIDVFYLSQSGIDETSNLVNTGTELLDVVISKMADGLTDFISEDRATNICSAFIFECSSKFGRQIGQLVVGRWNGDDLVKSIDVRNLLSTITSNEPLDPNVFELIESRCLQFLKSNEPNEETLKFHLTQTFYFCQLLGIDGGQFDPLAEHAFANSVFYMDTNVLFYGLIKHEESTKPFKELIKLCNRLNVKLRVTRATIDEARRAAASRITQLKQIDGNVPIEIVRKTNDDFISSFYDAREKDSEITIEGYFEQFEDLTATLTGYGIEVDDRNEIEILGNRKFEREVEIIQKEVLAVRKGIKPEIVLEHDIAHYALISDERIVNNKTWFLTVDGSLLRSAVKLANGQQPFCFSLPGFLQSISPFVSTDEETSLVEVFSAVFTEQIPTNEILFDAKELIVMSHLQEDILCSPPEQLADAFEFVRKNTLKGENFKDSETGLIALGLKKYFLSSVAERERALGATISRMGEETAAERKAREEAERKASETVAREESLRLEYEGLMASSSTVSQENVTLAKRLEKSHHRQRLFFAIITLIAGIFIAIYQDPLIELILIKFPRLLPDFVKSVVLWIGMLIFVSPSIYYVKKTKYSSDIQLVPIAIILILGLSLFKVLSDQVVSSITSYIDLAILVGGFLLLVKFRNNEQDSI